MDRVDGWIRGWTGCGIDFLVVSTTRTVPTRRMCQHGGNSKVFPFEVESLQIIEGVPVSRFSFACVEKRNPGSRDS